MHVAWLDRRSIDPEHAVVAMGLYSAKPGATGAEPIPDVGGNILAFPYVDGGREVNAKYRGPQKKFFQRTGARKTFFNADVLDDPALHSGQHALVITEGEPDAIVAIQCGHPHTVSCPDGAPADRDANGRPIPMKPDSELDPANDAKFEYVFNNWERLAKVKRIILATDGDGPGQRLRDELARRLGRVRCYFVEYPHQHENVVQDEDRAGNAILRPVKDLNEVRIHHGDEAVREVIARARAYPVRGLYHLAEYPEAPALTTYRTGWWTLDRHLQLWSGEFMMVLGIPSHGKSSWVQSLTYNLAVTYGWRAAIFSPEEPTVPQLRDKFRRLYLGRDPMPLERDGVIAADSWINENLTFIDADPTGTADDEQFSLEWLLDRATDAVLRDGIKLFIIDPWNEIEHAKRRDEMMVEYHGRAIRAVKRFARQYDVTVIVVAHPTKEVGKDGKARPPTPYDTDGAAHFYNKSDHFVIVHRPDETLNQAIIRVAKAKFEGTGEKGSVRLDYDRSSGRFSTLDELSTASPPTSGYT